MDTPICVCDAQTFIDHIHQIKIWIYGGHLRLVVPTSTSENVEHLYKKSVEPKPTAQESSRPKPAGKPARKVHPTFDINPTIAREFLSRIQKGKEGEQYVKERPLYEEDEKREALQFQTPKEEYTPWKGIPVEEQEVEVIDDRPLSWAELAKKKLQANGSADKSQLPKGPAKPKLVSKASGNDMQPWKMQKNAPTISAREVPGHLRSLMSCALWRLHESIDRNDSNQLFLLSDQEEIRVVAKKLNTTVRSTKELGEMINACTKKTNLDVTGMLEKENLVKTKDEVKIILSESTMKEEYPQDRVLVPSADGGLPSRVDRLGQDGIAAGVSCIDPPEDTMQQKQTDEKDPMSGQAAGASQGECLPRVPSEHSAQITLNPRELVQSILKPSLSQAQARHITEGKEAQDGMILAQNLQPVAEIMEASSYQARNETPTPVTTAIEPNASLAEPALSASQGSQDDSDEEVVVFVPNPKRMSAQKKAPASSSRPSTAHGQSPASPMQHSPRTSIPSAQGIPTATEHGSPQAQVVPPGNPISLNSGLTLNDSDQGYPQANVIPHSQPRPLSSGPTLIDPDAFGRGFTVNTGAGTLTNVGTSKKSRQHSPRTSMQYASPSANSIPTQNSPRTSPPRHKSGRSPRRSPRALPQKAEGSPPTSIPIISHQAYTRAPLVAANPLGTQQSRFGAIGPPSKSATNVHPSAPARDMDFIRDPTPRQNPIQRPRSAHSQSFASDTNQPHQQAPRQNPLNGSTASGRGGHREQRSSKPTLFEPELDRTGAPPDADFETKRANMPEVQYTLKSGTTREAARGKGKLWVG